ncbi:MAG: cation transporter [Bacteroidia bacterium]|jgi:cation diffusion facilitator family transporter|nr:cation transporter [Bacteroidia bacterium]
MAGNSTRVVVVAFVMNLGIAVAKYIAFLVTGSAAMLAESVHSLADTVNQIFLFLGIRRSAKAASPSHQFGYGMEQYVFSFLVAILIFSLGGAYSLYEGTHKIMHPSEKLEHADINLIILGIAIALEGYSSFIATKELKKTKGAISFFKYIRKTKDQVLVTVIFEDYAALLGLVIAGLGMTLYLITGNVLFDSIATILIGVLLVGIAVILYREAKSLLVGEAASVEDQAKIREAFENHPAVERLDELLTMHLSATQILVNAHVKFRGGLTLEEVENIIDEIEYVIVDAVPEVFKIFIETHQKSSVESFSGRKDAQTEVSQKKSVIRNSKMTSPEE